MVIWHTITRSVMSDILIMCEKHQIEKKRTDSFMLWIVLCVKFVLEQKGILINWMLKFNSETWFILVFSIMDFQLNVSQLYSLRGFSYCVTLQIWYIYIQTFILCVVCSFVHTKFGEPHQKISNLLVWYFIKDGRYKTEYWCRLPLYSVYISFRYAPFAS